MNHAIPTKIETFFFRDLIDVTCVVDHHSHITKPQKQNLFSDKTLINFSLFFNETRKSNSWQRENAQSSSPTKKKGQINCCLHFKAFHSQIILLLEQFQMNLSLNLSFCSNFVACWKKNFNKRRLNVTSNEL